MSSLNSIPSRPQSPPSLAIVSRGAYKGESLQMRSGLRATLPSNRRTLSKGHYYHLNDPGHRDDCAFGGSWPVKLHIQTLPLPTPMPIVSAAVAEHNGRCSDGSHTELWESFRIHNPSGVTPTPEPLVDRVSSMEDNVLGSDEPFRGREPTSVSRNGPLILQEIRNNV